MSNYDPVIMGIASPGGWGKRYLQASHLSDKFAITMCSSRNPTEPGIQNLAKEHDFEASSFDQLIKSNELEAILLPIPHFLHYEYAKRAIEAGKHVVLEKPITNWVDEAVELRRLAQKADIVLSVGHELRRTGPCRKAKEMLENGVIGSPVSTICYSGMKGTQLYSKDNWLLQGEKNPGGSLDMMGVHATETLIYLIGDIAQISGFLKDSLTPTTIPDSAVGIFQFEDGALGYYGSHYIAPYRSFIHIIGTEGILYIEHFGAELYHQAANSRDREKVGSSEENLPPNLQGAVKEELEEFADAIRLGTKIETGADEAIKALASIRGIMLSAKWGRPVTFDEVMANPRLTETP